MSAFDLQQDAQEVALEVTVIRANGTREELGTVAYWHRNPLKRLTRQLIHGKTGKVKI